jgi:hypothetical protein
VGIPPPKKNQVGGALFLVVVARGGFSFLRAFDNHLRGVFGLPTSHAGNYFPGKRPKNAIKQIQVKTTLDFFITSFCIYKTNPTYTFP